MNFSCMATQTLLKDLKSLRAHDKDSSLSQTFVDERTAEVIIITRHNPVSCNKVLFVVGTMYNKEAYTSQILIEGTGNSYIMTIIIR